MIYWILKSFLFLVLGVLTLSGFIDLLCYLRFKKLYEPQGLKFRYFPVLGYLFLVSPSLKIKDQSYRLKKFFKENSHEPAVMSNNSKGVNPFIFLNSPELVKDFFLKEIEISKKENYENFIFKNGFLYHPQKEAMHMRNIMSNMFTPANMQKVAPEIQKLIEQRVNTIKETFHSTNKWTKISLGKLMDELFTDIVASILFGDNLYKASNEAVEATQMIEKGVKKSIESITNPLNAITKGWAGKLGLISSENEATRITTKVKQKLRNIYHQRAEKKDHELESTILDQMIKNNRDAKKNGRKEDIIGIEAIVANIITFMFAGYDTSKNVSNSAFHLLSKKPDIQRELHTIVSEKLKSIDKTDAEAYEGNDYIEGFISETLRLFTPAPRSFARKLLKDAKIGKYRFYKGDYVVMPYISFFRNELYFENSEQFNPKRFMKENKSKIRRNTFSPFGNGRRKCIGRYLGELMVRMVVCNFVESFEFLEPENFDPLWKLDLTYGVEELTLLMKKR